MRNGLFVLALLDALEISILAGAGSASASEPGVDPESVFDFLPTELTILSPDDELVIGRGRYTVAEADGMILVEGVNEYLDGRRDRELERLTPGPPGEAPILVGAEHEFFNADGSPRIVDRLDARSGEASCTEYDSDGAAEVHRSTLAVPADTYAGATQLMLVVSRLRQGHRERIKLHSFHCMPGPKIIPIEVSVAEERTRWRMYPGHLAKTEIKPDLGWIGVLIAPFIGKMEVWFDPADRWNYVGATFDRFYEGEHILTVRRRIEESSGR